MNKHQWIAISIAVVLFGGLYLGFDTKNSNQKKTDRSRSIQGEATSFATLLEDAKEHLSQDQVLQVQELEQKSQQATNPADRSLAFKGISGFWYKFGNIPVAGGYADSVAIVEGTDAAWSVAGATYFNGLMAVKDNQTLRTYCADKAIRAFESAASLSPDEVEHRVNLALVYAENPKPDNPMQAVLMLRDMEAKYPNEPSVYNALGRLAIKTSQWQKAVDRLEKSWSLDKNNPNTPCLLARAYEGVGNQSKMAEFAMLCK